MLFQRGNLETVPFSMWENLSEDMKRVGYIVGVEERWIVRAMRGTIRNTDPTQRTALAIHQRFYTALALHDLAHEVPLATVANKYGATKVGKSASCNPESSANRNVA